MKKRPLSILYLPVDEGGCGWYRIRQWHDLFQGMDNVKSLIMTGKEEDSLEVIKSADVVVARIQDYEYVKEIKCNIDPLKPIVFDHDDNTMEVLPTSEHYKDFGTQDAYATLKDKDGEVTDIKPVWVTGVTEDFNRHKNLVGQMNMLYLVGVADLITTPVANLTQFYMQYASEACLGAIVPNSINFPMYPEGKFIPKDKKKKEIRIGWQGGVSHLGDWQEISKELGEVLEKYPQVTLHIMGSYYKNQFKEFKDRVTFYPWLPWKAFTYRIKTMGLDGAIIPLESKKFNEYKSEVKFTEFSQLGIPCLVKDMLPYSAVCEGGKNCYSYKTGDDFKTYLTKMIEDIASGSKKPLKYVKEAQKWVREERDSRKTAKAIVDLYKSILPDEIKEQLI